MSASLLDADTRTKLRLRIRTALEAAYRSASSLASIESEYGAEVVEELIGMDPVLRELISKIREITNGE